jgi:hypothetical protein
LLARYPKILVGGRSGDYQNYYMHQSIDKPLQLFGDIRKGYVYANQEIYLGNSNIQFAWPDS